MGNQKGKPIIFKLGNEKLQTSYDSIFQISAVDDKDQTVILGELLEGKKCMIVVNVASKCPLTKKQYTELAELYREYRQFGLEILAFPCNQFLNSEPSPVSDVIQHVKDTY